MSRPRKLDHTHWQLIIDEYTIGTSLRDLAKKHNISKSLIELELKARGVPMRSVGQPKSANPYESLEVTLKKLEQRYNTGEITETQMANEYMKYVNEYERRQNTNYYKYNESLESLSNKQLQLATSNQTKPSSINGEIYDDMMNAIREQLEDKTIGKSEALKRYLHLEQEFDELGREDFDAKYIKVYPELK